MAKYRFIKNYAGGTYVPPGQGRAQLVEFKQGDIVEGSMIRNNFQSEPPNFIVVNSPKGAVHIPYGGRAGSVLEPAEKEHGLAGKEIQPTTNNLPDPRTKRYLIIGVLVIVLVGLMLAYKKYPKAVKTVGVVVLIALVIKGLFNYKKHGNLIGWH